MLSTISHLWTFAIYLSEWPWSMLFLCWQTPSPRRYSGILNREFRELPGISELPRNQWGHGNLDKHFINVTRKKSPTAKKFGIFSLSCSWNWILNQKFNLYMTAIRIQYLLTKVRALFFDFQRRTALGPVH